MESKKEKNICKFPGDRKVWYPYHENSVREQENTDLGIIIYQMKAYPDIS